jgi:hypothetical protein
VEREPVVAVAIIAITAGREDAAKMLLECDARFSCDACRVGIDRAKKILDLFLSLTMNLEPHLRTVWCGGLAWLDLLVHF